jgi:sulfur carrier protein
MILLINDKPIETRAWTLADLIKEQQVEGAFALAVNETFVPKSQYPYTLLTEHDRIEIVAPMQGG